MAVCVRRLVACASSQTGHRLVGIRCCDYSACSADGIEPDNAGGAGLTYGEFRKWHKGGGTYHLSALISATAHIEIGAVVHSKAVLGEHVCIGSGSVIGPAVSVGQSTKIGYNVSLANCTIGDSCVIHNGVCVGQDGFGFYVYDTGSMVKKPQIGSHVEIGANTCIDRGSWRDTVIGDYTKIDNLVQIGHNVVIGKNCMLCGQVGIAGSATLGDLVTLGGRVAVRDHVSIASKVRLAANSSVTKRIEVPGDYGGFPAVPILEWRRQFAVDRRAQKAAQGSLIDKLCTHSGLQKPTGPNLKSLKMTS